MMENKLDIIRFNDDNHSERIWVEGQYVGDLSDIEYVFENLLLITRNAGKLDGINSTLVYVCDDFYDFDEDNEEDEEIVDNICNWFNEVEIMTEEQMEKVHNKDWKALNDLIN